MFYLLYNKSLCRLPIRNTLYYRKYHASVNYAACCTPHKINQDKQKFNKDNILCPTFYISHRPIVSQRYLHNSFALRENENDKPSSQVEVTVHDLKEKSKQNSTLKTTSTIIQERKDKDKLIEKKSLGGRIIDEILHYYHGFKLLFFDVAICGKYVKRILKGEILSRREHRQLIRTTGDLFRLLPFSVFIIIPFMEFLLPVALKLFPGMLPSTFETANQKEAKMKKQLRVKLEVAKFFQQTLDTMGVEGKGHRSERAKEFVTFFNKVRKTGENVSNEEILKFIKLFEDEITLDSLPRPQLVALCRLLEMQPFGTNNFLRFQLRMRLTTLASDDKIIKQEGVESMAVWELQQACRSRGMRAFGRSKDRLQEQLQQWLDMSLNEKVPPSLLLLSRTLFLSDELPTKETLAATISTLPEEVATHTKASIGDREGKVDNQTRLEILHAEEKKIKEDKRERMHEEEERQKREMALKKRSDDAMMKESQDAAKLVGLEDMITPIISSTAGRMKMDKEVLVDKAPELVDKATPIETAKETEERISHEKLSARDIDYVEEALEMIELEKRKAFLEESELLDLKAELADYEEDVQDFKQALEDAGMTESNLRESKAARRLFAKVNSMCVRMTPVVKALYEQKKTLDSEATRATDKQETETELINLDELAKHLKNLASSSNASKMERIMSVLSKMDVDMDGAVKTEAVLRVLRMLSEDSDVDGVSAHMLEEVVQMMMKEEQLEATTLARKALQLPSLAVKRTLPVAVTPNGAARRANEGGSGSIGTETPPGIPPVLPPEITRPQDNSSASSTKI